MSFLDELKQAYKEKIYLVNAESLQNQLKKRLIDEASRGYTSVTIHPSELPALKEVNSRLGVEIIEEEVEKLGLKCARITYTFSAVITGWGSCE